MAIMPTAVDGLLGAEAELWRVGGSIAQRDLVEWTLTEAAIRAGQRDVALSLANERLALRPRECRQQSLPAGGAGDQDLSSASVSQPRHLPKSPPRPPNVSLAQREVVIAWLRLRAKRKRRPDIVPNRRLVADLDTVIIALARRSTFLLLPYLARGDA